MSAGIGQTGVGRGQKPPTTQATEACSASGNNEGMTLRPGTAADRDSKGNLHRHPDGADGARPKNGMQLRCKYGLLAPEDLAGNPDTAGTQVRGDVQEDTRRTEEQGLRPTDTGDGTVQRALLARGMLEDKEKVRRNPERQRAINACIHQGGEGGGGPLTRQRMPTEHS